MLIEHSNRKLWCVGDPHMGKKFPNTPLHRRGERELLQRQAFIEELNTPDVEMIVMVGDLVDQPIVPLKVLSQIISDVVEAAQANPGVEYVMMAGNHDISRQLTEPGAWEIFSLAVGWLENVQVLNDPQVIKGVLFLPWEWGISTEEQVASLPDDLPEIVIGHCDLKDFGGDTSHLFPTKSLAAKGVTYFVGGHYHTEGDYEVDGITVHCTGSLEPYAHGEGDMYVTLTLEEALAQADDLKDKCVRIKLEPGEVMPDLDCLQLSAIRPESAEAIEIEVTDSFDVKSTLNEVLAEDEVPEEVCTFIKEKLGAAA